MFEQTFKNIDDILHKDAGCGSELDYVEQTSWILFLKYLDDLEKDRATAANLQARFTRQLLTRRFLQNIDLGSLGYARHYRLLKEINVAYPKSLPEQQRIVSILDEAFSVIERSRNNAEQNPKNAKELFESYLQRDYALTGL